MLTFEVTYRKDSANPGDDGAECDVQIEAVDIDYALRYAINDVMIEGPWSGWHVVAIKEGD